MRFIIFASAVLMAGLAATSSFSSTPLRVVASFSVLGDMVARIGGDRVQVTSIIGPNADAHAHSPIPADLRAISAADMVVTNGLGFDRWMERSIEASAFEGLHLSIGKTTQVHLESLEEFLNTGGHVTILYEQNSDWLQRHLDSGHPHDDRSDHDHADNLQAHEEDGYHHERNGSHAHAQKEHDHDEDHAHSNEEDGHGYNEDHAHSNDEDGHGHDHGHDHSYEKDGHGHDEDHAHSNEEDGYGHDHGHDHSGLDPHAWQSPIRSIAYIGVIAKALVQVDPAHRSAYIENGRRYLSSLLELDKEMTGLVSSLSAERRRIVTAHDSFRYLERDYGLSMLAIEGLSTESTPSAANIARLVQQAERGEIAAAFTDNVTDPRPMRQFLRETGLTEGGFLYSDALSSASEPAYSHLGMLRHNLLTLSAALNAEGHDERRVRLEGLTIPAKRE